MSLNHRRKTPGRRTGTHVQRARRRGDWRPMFLEELSRHGCVLWAAETAGVDRSTVYTRRQTDEEFAVDMADALDYSVEMLEHEAVKRAMGGSDWLLMFLLKARRPALYRENYKLPGITTLDETQLMELTCTIRNALDAIALTPKQEREFEESLMSNMKLLEEKN